MSLFNIKPLVIKKTIIIIISIFIGFLIGFVTDRLSNGKISDFITLSMMYFKNSEEIKFNGIILEVPFRYTRIQDKDNLTLLKFPKGGGIIFFHNVYLPKDRFDNEFKETLYKMQFELVNEGEIIINNEKGYFITVLKKTNPSEYEEYITIPSKNIIASFIGNKKDSPSFWEIVNKIQFIS